MPPLSLFGRRQFVAGDEIVFPAALSLLVEIPATVVSSFLATVFVAPKIEAQVPLILSAVVHGVGALLDVLLIIVSTRGAAWELERRRHLPHVLVVRRLAELPKVAVIVLYIVHGKLFEPDTAAKAARTNDTGLLALLWILLVGQCADLLCRVASIIFMDTNWCCCCYKQESTGEPLMLGPISRWFRFLGRLAGARGEEKLIIKLLAEYLRGYDWTPGDLVEGAMLLQSEQRLARERQESQRFADLGLEGTAWGAREERQLLGSCGGAMVGLRPVEEKRVLKDVLHHLGFAMAAYGWAVDFIFPRADRVSLRDCCQKYSHFRDQEGRERAKDNAESAIALLQIWPGHKGSRLVFYSPYVGVGISRFSIFVDFSKRNVVIAVRGTLGVSDTLTDLCATPQALQPSAVTGPSEGPHYVHSGMWEAALFIFRALKTQRVLQDLNLLAEFDESSSFCPEGHSDPEGYFASRTFQAAAMIEQPFPDCKDFGLVVVGHSLGGGVAQYLKAMLTPHFPQVRSVVFGAPPGFSEEMSKYHASNAINVVCGDDIIARLCIRNMELMRDRMVSLLARCRKSKFMVIVDCFLYQLFNAPRFLRHIERKISSPPVRKEALDVLGSPASRELAPPCFHAGHVMYLRSISEPIGWMSAKETSKYSAEWADTDDCQEILMTGDAIFDHFPDRYRTYVEGALLAFSRRQEVSCLSSAASSVPESAVELIRIT